MQYALFHLSVCCIYTAVSVCIVKLIRLNTRNPAAYVYLFFVALAASASGSLSLNVERRGANAGLCGEE